MRLSSLILLSMLLFACAGYQDQPSEVISIEELGAHIKYLASDSLQGRKPGTPGGRAAAEYIAGEFRSIGLTPMGDEGYQYFEVVRSVEQGEANRFILDEYEAVVSEDYSPLSYSASAQVAAEVIFVGYGFSIDEDSLSWDDYTEIDVNDKWVMILRGNPENDEPASPYDLHSDLRKKVLVARDHGAGGVLLVAGLTFDESDELIDLSFDMSQAGAGLPVLNVKRTLADRILAGSETSIETLESGLNTGLEPNSFATGTKIDVTTDVRQISARTQNVVAMLPGSDPALSAEIIIIGAHYDHLGFGGPNSGSRRPDAHAIHNGADDNASGVAAIIEIAEMLATSSAQPSRSVFFMAFGAEEMGLLGSKYFARNPLFDLEDVKLMFNLDMVGRLDPETKALTVGGTGTALGMDNILEQLAAGRDFKLGMSPGGYGPSDHASFYVENIPVLFFFTGIHTDYHTPDDDFDKINLPGEKAVADYVAALATRITDLPEALVFQEAGPKAPSARSRRFKVTLGIMPDYASSEERGLRVDGIVPDKPADLAGMQKGDIIVAMEGKSVKDIYDYMYRLGEFKSGQRISVDVLRGEKTVILIVEL